MVVVCVEAVRGLFDDPTCFGTCVSIWRLVRALYSATFLRGLNLLATFGACVGKAARDDTTSDSKLFATVARRLHVPRLHGTVDCDMAIWTFIFQQLVRRFFCARWPVVLSMATLLFVDPWDFRVLGSDVGVGFVHLYVCFFVFCWTCFYGFLALRTSFASSSLFTFYLLDLRVYFLQDFCNFCLCDLAASSFQPGMRMLSGDLHVYAYVTISLPCCPRCFFLQSEKCVSKRRVLQTEHVQFPCRWQAVHTRYHMASPPGITWHHHQMAPHFDNLKMDIQCTHGLWGRRHGR